MIALVLAVVAVREARRRGWQHPLAAGATLWGLVVVVLPTAAAVAVLVAVRRWRRAAAITRDRAAADSDVVLLADLVGLGVASGRTVRGALEAARPHIHPALSSEVQTLLGEMDRLGTAPALAAAGARLADLGRVTAAAVTSGAPVVAAITAHADRVRHTRHEARITASRRLPVRLLLPLALLILPGFVVLAVGPALLQALARLAPIP